VIRYATLSTHQDSGAAQTTSALLTPAQTENYLQISRTTLKVIVKRGELHPLRIGRVIRFVRTELDEWIRSRMGDGSAVA